VIEWQLYGEVARRETPLRRNCCAKRTLARNTAASRLRLIAVAVKTTECAYFGGHGGIRASDSAVAGYKIFRNGTQIATSTTDLLCRSLGRPKYELSLPSGGV
jgi:hypothetical protein